MERRDAGAGLDLHSTFGFRLLQAGTELYESNQKVKAMAKIILSVEDAASRDQQIEHSCSRLRSHAIDCGILVTRVDYGLFEIALSPDVPFGLTNEMDLL